MCLYPKRIKNPKYQESRNNIEGVFNIPSDARLLYIEIPCGYCVECRKKKAREWGIRLKEELKKYHGIMVTLTFNDEELNKLYKEFNSIECNGIAYRALRRFCERYRKKYKVALRHWFVTELGHSSENRPTTERIHLHGILFTEKGKDIEKEEIAELWKYGFVHKGDYCNERTINYILKYVLKVDEDHKGYIQKIYASKNIGVSERINNRCKFNGNNTIDNIRNESGNYIQLPEYYKRKLWTSEEREFIRLKKENEHKFYLGGVTYDLGDLTEQDKEEIRQNLRRRNNNKGNGEYFEKKLYSVRNVWKDEEIKENKIKNKYYEHKMAEKDAEIERFKEENKIELFHIKKDYELYINKLQQKAVTENSEYIKKIWQKSN